LGFEVAFLTSNSFKSGTVGLVLYINLISDEYWLLSLSDLLVSSLSNIVGLLIGFDIYCSHLSLLSVCVSFPGEFRLTQLNRMKVRIRTKLSIRMALHTWAFCFCSTVFVQLQPLSFASICCCSLLFRSSLFFRPFSIV